MTSLSPTSRHMSLGQSPQRPHSKSSSPSRIQSPFRTREQRYAPAPTTTQQQQSSAVSFDEASIDLRPTESSLNLSNSSEDEAKHDNNNVPVKSVRMQQLRKVVNRALSESRKSVDTQALIKEVYGDDLQVFGDAQVLESVFSSLFEQVHESVNFDMEAFFKRENVQEKLARVEQAILKLREKAKEEQEAERVDKESARNALQAVSLPPQTDPQDIVRFRAYQQMKEQQESIQSRIQALEREIADLEINKQNTMSSFQSTLDHLNSVSTDFSNAADSTSAYVL